MAKKTPAISGNTASKRVEAPQRTTTRRGRSASSGESLVDWHEPESNAHVLDWRERAHNFGLLPVEDHGAVDEPLVEPAERLLEEEEPEAFDDQPLEDAEEEALAPEEVEEAPEAHIANEDVDLVRVYLKH